MGEIIALCCNCYQQVEPIIESKDDWLCPKCGAVQGVTYCEIITEKDSIILRDIVQKQEACPHAGWITEDNSIVCKQCRWTRIL